jgi:hypothetical protein
VDNSVELQVVARDYDTLRSSYLEITIDDPGPRDFREVVYFAPQPRSATVRQVLLPRNFTTSWMGGAFAEGAAGVVAAVRDCTGRFPISVRYELPNLSDSTVLQCDGSFRCAPASQANFAFANIAASDIEREPTIVVRAPETGKILAGRRFWARTGWTTQVFLWPLTRSGFSH